MRLSRNQNKFGTLQRELSPLKDAIDYHLTKAPSLYLFVERFREWVNWDKRVYLSFVRHGDVVLDVGANAGAHTVFLSNLVQKRGRVLAFEPLPPNIDLLAETIRRRARFTNISVFQVAVGDPSSQQGLVTIRIPGEDLTQASLVVQTTGSWEGKPGVREVTVPLISLDACEAVQSLHRMDLVKIDVEGGELDVLRGASRTLSHHMPFLYCEAYETWQAAFGYAPGDLIDFARSLGYTAARVFSQGEVHPIRLDEAVSRELFTTSADILFFSKKHFASVERFDRRYDVHTNSR